MHNSTKQKNHVTQSLTLAAALLLAGSAPVWADGASTVAPPESTPYGKTYPQWAGAWWKWFMELPLQDANGTPHPATDCANFDLSEGQSGDVWFLASPFGNCTRTASIPSGKALFVTIINAEWSSLENAGPPICSNISDSSCQLANASFFADHIVDLSFEVDGAHVSRISSFRVVNSQINFFAPCPCWIFKCVPSSRPAQPPAQACGPATSTGDGYFVFLNPLSPGQHTIHYTGAFKFTQKKDGFDAYIPLDMTYNLTVL